ncbi:MULTISPECIES: lipopolysaccharide kinase InaA family protein [Halopseudomonas]|jgi:tRNA A-37 threonylcarbamoyl transferase component Bud32|uniref:lipopolysaccharide kinase InaA family protein n=1 Tax=Halopseudomonas TaxID=2901189 RepID=UPI0022B74CD5|nr:MULTISPECIES: lipopolysaccharide kinase InaA family protein [Halopseudomonas]BDX17340.1 hypothetical protein MFKK_01500 [Halopseudomonas aestusnigri]GMQ53321.1 hypothetical protein YSKK_11840 [Halopseudomonas aestusnigri]
MQHLATEQFESWLGNAEVIEKDGHGVKVLRLADGSFLKLFRYKRLFSKNRLISPAKRFSRNATLLHQLNIPCPRIISTYRLSNPERSVVHYTPLEGETIRHLLRQPDTSTGNLLRATGAFIAELHNAGVYFRSLHPGNIIYTPERRFGLIDIADLSCQKSPLSNWQRRRNLRHLLRYNEDWQTLSQDNLRQLAAGYEKGMKKPLMLTEMARFRLLSPAQN